MAFAYPMQKLQDWLSQQWVIIMGRKIDPLEHSWLYGPFGNLEAVREAYIHQLAAKEHLVIEKEFKTKGLLPAIQNLNLSEADLSRVSPEVIDFYENTSNYDLHFTVKWNPFFQVFGFLVIRLFSERLNQLNIPLKNSKTLQSLKSELTVLTDPVSNVPKYTFWTRSIKPAGKTIYTGIYGSTSLPSGQTCVKAIFPLPNGNATVLLSSTAGEKGELILESSGNKFGDAGFYFLLKDSKGKYWSQYIKSFRDRLTVRPEENGLSAEQVITLWHLEVMRFNYIIKKK